MGAHDHMVSALRAAGVRQVLSKEAETAIPLNPTGLWDVAIDPITGFGSLGIGAPLGLLFSVMPVAAEGFLLTGRTVVAAGYASFGHSCDFGFSLGAGVDIATLDQPQDRFRLTHQNLHLTKEAKTVVFEASIERRWPPGLQAWAGDLRAGKDGPRERDFNMRWLAAAVGELQGGCLLYTADRRTGDQNGRLRTVYEAVPIAFLIERAGGLATDGLTPILDRQPRALHEKTPLVFGARDEVVTIAAYLSGSGRDLST